MKRYKYFDKDKSITLYQAIYDVDNLRLAHKNASRGKQWYKEVQKVNQDLDNYLYKLQNMFINKTYKTSKYTIFTKKEHNKESNL